MRQAIRGGLQQDQLKLCGFGVPVDWDRVPALAGDATANGFWWSLVLIQAIALQAGRGGGSVGGMPVPLPPPAPPPALTPPPVAAPFGSSAENAAPTCRHILAAGAATGDGVYWLDPAGGDPFPAYCDMTRDDGGWTLYAIGAELPASAEQPSVTDPRGSQPQVLRQDRAEALAAVSTGLFRISDPALEQSFFIRDVRPLFASSIGGFGRGHVWATNAGSVACATSYAQVRGTAMVATGTFDIDCESRGPGSHTCGTANGWILFHRGGTYDYDAQHPCSFGHGESQGLVVRWMR